ncbi:MAG: DegT/DnrJ/EryC1/StrS family aminotransferase [Chloroflexota bacterium]
MAIRLTKPYTNEDELREIAGVLATGHLTQGPKVAEFEAGVAQVVGCKHAIAVSSATAALHLAVCALDVGPGDEVAVADFTYPATGNVVALRGAKPVLVDIDLDRFALDPAALEPLLNDRTRAVIVVHPFGVAAPLAEIQRLCDARGVPVIEDAACAIGATYRGRQVGTFGAAGCFSFHPRKGITTGEGGMVTTNDDRLADRVRRLRNHGAVKSDSTLAFVEAGYNYRMSDLLAAVGVAQLRKLDYILAARRTVAHRYTAALADVPGLRCPVEPEGALHTYQSYILLLEPETDRDTFLTGLRSRGIECTIGTYALHAQPFFSQSFGYTPGQLPQSWQAYSKAVTLPLFVGMTDQEIATVIGAVQETARALPARG